MKKIFSICAAILITASVFAQSPEKMSYQAVIRNSSNNLVTNTLVGMQISILQGSASGIAVYVETQTPTTNANGLISIEIGAGTVVSGDFTTINWANGNYFIKTETAVEAPITVYTITGVSQLLSVPYALHAKTAETITGSITEIDPIYSSSVASSITGADTTNWNNKQNKLIAGLNISITGNTINAISPIKHYVGELYGGGIVFWVDHTGQHGLIVSMVTLSANQVWSNIATTEIGTTNDWDGNTNTSNIIGQNGQTSSAALLCANYTNTDYGTGIYSDWYLPSILELNHLWNNFYEVQKALTNDGNTSTSPIERNAGFWSSTEIAANYAFYYLFSLGQTSSISKNAFARVLAVRVF